MGAPAVVNSEITGIYRVIKAAVGLAQFEEEASTTLTFDIGELRPGEVPVYAMVDVVEQLAGDGLTTARLQAQVYDANNNGREELFFVGELTHYPVAPDVERLQLPVQHFGAGDVGPYTAPLNQTRPLKLVVDLADSTCDFADLTAGKFGVSLMVAQMGLFNYTGTDIA